MAMFGWFSEASSCASRLEARHTLGVGRKALGEHLDGHVAPEPRVASPIDFPHPADPEQRENFRRAEARPDQDGMMGGLCGGCTPPAGP